MRSDTGPSFEVASVRSFMAITSPNAFTIFSRRRVLTSASCQ